MFLVRLGTVRLQWKTAISKVVMPPPLTLSCFRPYAYVSKDASREKEEAMAATPPLPGYFQYCFV
jgi:hypothetical protein